MPQILPRASFWNNRRITAERMWTLQWLFYFQKVHICFSHWNLVTSLKNKQTNKTPARGHTGKSSGPGRRQIWVQVPSSAPSLISGHFINSALPYLQNGDSPNPLWGYSGGQCAASGSGLLWGKQSVATGRRTSESWLHHRSVTLGRFPDLLLSYLTKLWRLNETPCKFSLPAPGATFPGD